ncbi:ion transporter [Lyngbya confervoides]|uniref:Ion transporter n=1 Tax=Lyngbya confervoides BDU141951 TaxID=1574623 RepID=A0ABD4T6F9_9CYAN|nr:ion transporter [Lyngbya confervoides]MCM1984149.1 ion transporter [Lyngbya confervoides BDU141951]
MSDLSSPPSPEGQSLREKVAFYLEVDNSPIGLGIDLGILGLILLFSLSFVLNTFSLPSPWQQGLDWLNGAILCLFTLEYGLRLWSAENRLRYLFSPFALIDLMAILPLWLGVLDGRLIRIFRWFRLLRFARFLQKKQRLTRFFSPNTVLFARTLFTLFSIIFIYAGFIYQAEHLLNPEQFATFLDSFYFSVVTMTTVGFGDITPISQAGRLFTVLMILTGVALVPWQLGELIRQLFRSPPPSAALCPQCGPKIRHDGDARYCKRCGTALRIQEQTTRERDSSPVQARN